MDDPSTNSSDKHSLSAAGPLQEESLDSEDEDAAPVAKDFHSDTEGEEMSMDEVARNLSQLVESMEHTLEFYDFLNSTLSSVSIQFLDTNHVVLRLSVRLIPHVSSALANDHVRAAACQPFSYLIRNKACIREFLRTQYGMTYLLNATRRVDDSKGMRHVLISCLRMLSASRTCRAEIMRCSGVPTLLSLLDEEAKSSMESKAAVIFTLRRLCKSTSCRELIANLNGLPQLLNFFFMQDPAPPPSVQKSLAGLLQTLATNPDVKFQLGQLDAIPKFVSLLSMNQIHMLKYIICIVRNVACNNDENRMVVARAGGIKQLLQLMPLVNVKLQQKIAGALQNLATNRENRSEIAQFGGITVLIGLINTHDQKLQKYGLGGLKRLVYNSRESTLMFQKLGGLPPLIALLDSDDVSVLKNAMHALNRVRHYLGREPIEALGGVTSMVRLLTCPHEKIRLLARRNLQSMDEDITEWLVRVERTALLVLRSSRVLLNPHAFVGPNASATEQPVSESGFGRFTSRVRRSLVGGLRLRSSKTSRTSTELAAAAAAPPALTTSGSLVSIPSARADSKDAASKAKLTRSTGSADDSSDADISPRSANNNNNLNNSNNKRRGSSTGFKSSESTEDLALSPISPAGSEAAARYRETLTSLGFSDTYWNLRPGTNHFLPTPVMQLVLSELDTEKVLSKMQHRIIFQWARDRRTLGKSRKEFLDMVLNSSSANQADDDEDMDRKASCSIM